MPAGGKRPLGGNLKSRAKATVPSSAAAKQKGKDKSAEVEEESEVELDMGANNITLYEPNVLYLEEKPHTVVKSKKTPAPNTKITKKNEPKKTITKCRNKTKTSVIEPNIMQEYIVKQELSILGEPQDEMLKNMDPNDPLYTPLIEVKCELADDNDEKYQDNDNFDPNYDLDESLIMLTRSKRRPRNNLNREMEVCKPNINSFCYCCGKYVPRHGKKGHFSADFVQTYEMYFNRNMIMNKNWVPNILCKSCYNRLMDWKNGRRESMPFGIPMTWTYPGDGHNPLNCYACANKGAVLRKTERKSYIYISVASAQTPLPHSEYIPVPKCPSPDVSSL